MSGAAGPALAVGGGLLRGLNAAGAERGRNRELKHGIRQQGRAGTEAGAALGDFISRLRTSAPNPAAERGAFSAALTGPTISGPGGAQFRADAAGRTAGARGYGNNMADFLARIRAPGLQRQREGEMFMDYGNTLRPIQLRSADDAFLTQLRAGMKQPNPWLDLLGQGASAAGSYLMSGKGG